MTFKVCRNCYSKVGMRRRVCTNKCCRSAFFRAATAEEVQEQEAKDQRCRQLLRELLEQHRENPRTL